MRPALALAALSLAAVALSACSTEAEMRGIDPSASPSSGQTVSGDPARPSQPLPEGPVSTKGPAMVLDEGSGAELCLGPVAMSLPPQCNGIPLEDWEWGKTGSQKAGGVTWGSYAVTGTFDGTTFTVTDAIPAALYDAASPPPDSEPDPLASACESPTSTDPSRSGPEDLDATLTAAAELPGYASTWLDRKTVNVAVTKDPSTAEKTLRKTWGGPLCVVEATYSDAELNKVNGELQAALPSLSSSGSSAVDRIDAEVLYDDGSLQAWADQRYGPGVVEISSALVSAG